MVSHRMTILDVCRISDTHKVMTLELYEGHWPSDNELLTMFREDGYTLELVDVQSRIKQIYFTRG